MYVPEESVPHQESLPHGLTLYNHAGPEYHFPEWSSSDPDDPQRQTIFTLGKIPHVGYLWSFVQFMLPPFRQGEPSPRMLGLKWGPGTMPCTAFGSTFRVPVGLTVGRLDHDHMFDPSGVVAQTCKEKQISISQQMSLYKKVIVAARALNAYG